MADERPLTKAQAWVVRTACETQVLGGYTPRSVIFSMKTGQSARGHREDVVAACRAAGWIDADGRATECGRRAVGMA